MTADDRLLTTEDLAAMLRLPKRTVADWRQRGGGPPAVKIGRHVRYRPADVEAWPDVQDGATARTGRPGRPTPRGGPVMATRCAQCGVNHSTGFRDLFSISRERSNLPEWTEQLASFNREHLVKHEQAAPGLSAHIVVSRVPTFSFADLLGQHNMVELDVLQIDAEGMDAQLLGWFLFPK